MRAASELLSVLFVIALAVASPKAGSARLSAEDPDDRAWIEGKAALGRKEWSAAADHFSAYRARHLSDPAGWILEAWTRRESGQNAEADALFQGVLKLDATQPDALLHFAEEAWHAGDRVEVLKLLESIEQVPEHISESYHHLFGVTLVVQGREPASAIRHLTLSGRDDKATRVLLALAYLRVGDESGARPHLERVCPSALGETPGRAWLGCVDADFCGDTLDQHLEVLRRVLTPAPYGGSDVDLADAVRVYIRHKRRPDDLLSPLAAAATRQPDACRLPLLAALARDLPVGSATPEGCRLLEEARSCSERQGNLDWPPLAGPRSIPERGQCWICRDLAGSFPASSRTVVRLPLPGDSAPIPDADSMGTAGWSRSGCRRLTSPRCPPRAATSRDCT